MLKVISTKRFENSDNLASVLDDMWATAFRTEDTNPDPLKVPKPVLYVLGPDGTQFSTAELHQEKLTDGSMVYHIVLKA